MAERILMTNGKLKVTDNPIIPFIEGDGVGRDIWKNAQAIFDKAVEVAYGVHDVITVTASTPEQTKTFKVLVRFDADADIRYYKNGGILPMVVRKKLKGA